MMASNFDWIQEILERISKDSKEAFWRSVGESVAPETITISEGIGYKYVISYVRVLVCIKLLLGVGCFLYSNC